MAKLNTREKLIKEGWKALLNSGYDGVGIGPILKAAGVPKGSFYHFFASKEAFVCAVLDAHAERYHEARREVLEDESVPPLTRLRRYFEYLERLAGDDKLGGCLFGNLALTASSRSPAFQRSLVRAFETWQGDLRGVLRQAQEQGDLPPGLVPDATAAYLIDAYEGALLRTKAEGNMAPFKRFINISLDQLLASRN
ncbi:TetR/AcrR family transcriptional regulator [Aquibaculum sediminis]|uniref:TetR/AcrR family transcriptional regulator n=1 Tax=Aquibaculum sediminis TaxID=3231907 RepID=UPI003452523B